MGTPARRLLLVAGIGLVVAAGVTATAAESEGDPFGESGEDAYVHDGAPFPASSVMTLLLKEEAQLLAKGEHVVPKGVLPIPHTQTAVFLVSRGRSGMSAEPTVIRLIDVSNRTTVWEKPWPAVDKDYQALHLALGSAGLSVEHGRLRVTYVGRDSPHTCWFELADGADYKPFAPPQDHELRATLGTLSDGRIVAWSSLGDPPSRIGSSPAAPYQDLRILVGRQGLKPGLEIPIEQVCGEPAPNTMTTPEWLTSSGILLLLQRTAQERPVESRDEDEGEEGQEKDASKRGALLAFAIPTRSLLWKVSLIGMPLGVRLDGERAIVEIGRHGMVRHPITLFSVLHDSVQVIDVASGRVLYGHNGRERRKRSLYPAGAQFVLATPGLDLYQGFDAADEPMVYAVNNRTGDVVWSVSGSAGDSVNYDPATDEVTLCWRMGGVRLKAQTGTPCAALRPVLKDRDYPEQGEELIRVGGTWVLGSRIVAEAEQSGPRRVHILEALPYMDHKLGGTVYPDTHESLPLLIKALKHERVEYRRGAVADLAGLAQPFEAGSAILHLAAALSDSDVEVRQGAARALLELGPHVSSSRTAAAIPAIHAAMEDPDPLVRKRTAIAFALFDPASDSAGDAALALATDPDEEIRSTALAALIGAKPRWSAVAVAAIRKGLADADEKERLRSAGLIHAADMLRRNLDSLREVVPELGRCCSQDRSDDVRLSCVRALGLLGSRAAPALPAVRQVLGMDPSERIREEALRTLVDIGPEPGDVALLKGRLADQPQTWWFASRGLARAGPAGVAVLLEAIDGADAQLRLSAINGLGWAGEHGRVAVKPLLAYLRKLDAAPPSATARPPSRAEILSAVLRTLGRLEAPEALATIMEYARRQEKDDATAAFCALWDMEEAAAPAIPFLCEQLKSDVALRRELAARALGAIGPQAKVAEPQLKDLANDKDETVRKSAAAALAKIRGAL